MKKHISSLLFVGMVLISCNKSANEPINNEALSLSLEAQIGKPIEQINVRGEDERQTNLTNYFLKNDAIGLFMEDQPAVKWIKNETDWEGEVKMYWPSKTKLFHFYAFYPYASATDLTSIPMPSLKAQNGVLESTHAYDFLVATKNQDYGENGTVSFTGINCFKHLSCLLSLTFKGIDSMENAEFTKIILNGTNLVSASTYSFTDEKITYTDDSQELIINNIIKASSEGATYNVIVNALDSKVSLNVEYKVDGQSYKAALPELTSTLKSGYQQKYTIEVKGVELRIVGTEVQPWATGETKIITIDGEEI